MKRISLSPFSASINLGLEYGYRGVTIDENRVIKFIQEYQESLIKEKNIHLSCSISKIKIVLSGQVEPHLKIGFINYPKFAMEEPSLKREIEGLGKSLMKRFEQNRIVIEYLDETVMFEESDEIDKRIKTGS